MKVHVNGQSIEVPNGSNVSVINGQVFINGGDFIDHGGQNLPEVTKLVIEGNAGEVKTDYASVEIKGRVTGNVNAGGHVSAGAVGGDVVSGGHVSCGHIQGSVKAGGHVSCGAKLR